MSHLRSIAPQAVRVLGGLEILGAIGLVLPPLTGIAPWLAVAAATCFVVLQVGATILHLSRGETTVIQLDFLLVVMAAIAAWFATAWL